MPVISQEVALKFASEWIEAWNAHDLDAILAHYTQDFEFCSPLVSKIANETSGCLKGQESIRRYWSMGLAKIPDLNFTLIDVLAGVDSVAVYYRGHIGTVVELFHFNTVGKVFRSMACYTVLPPNALGRNHA
jgi:ketosteroid isomerase-like protein